MNRSKRACAEPWDVTNACSHVGRSAAPGLMALNRSGSHRESTGVRMPTYLLTLHYPNVRTYECVEASEARLVLGQEFERFGHFGGLFAPARERPGPPTVGLRPRKPMTAIRSPRT